jgi:hypothetical protein
MANFEGILTMVDAFTRVKTKRVEIVASDNAAALVAQDAFYDAIHAVSDAGVLKSGVAAYILKTDAPEAGANSDAGCTLRVRLDNGKIGTIKFPCPKVSIFKSDGSVDTANADVAALVALFETGGSLRLSEGNYVVELLGGELDK